jgi:DNA invertase Pin-like site-specific DNA recombinase
MAGKRAIIWTAVSSEEQARDDKESLQYQEQLAREHAAQHGLDVVDVIRSDDSRSIVRLDKAMQNPRLGYARLMDAIDRREFDVLFFYHPDRLGRNMALSVTVQEELRAAGIVLYDLSNPPHTLQPRTGDAERIAGALQAWSAQSDVDKLRRRHTFGMIGRIKQGHMPSRPAYGYIAVGDKIVIDDGPAAVVRRIFALYLSGYGTHKIAEMLNADNIPAPAGGQWEMGSVRSIRDNAVRYAGYTEINKSSPKGRPYTRALGTWEPLLDEATLQAVEREIAARWNNRHLANTPYLLSGVVWCLECQRPMRMWTQTQRGGYQYLRISCDSRTHSHALPAYRVMEYIRDRLRELTLADIDRLVANDDTADKAQADIDRARTAIARLRKSLQDADDERFINGTMDADRYKRLVQRLQADIATQETEIARLTATLQREAEQGSRRARLMDVLQHWEAMLDSRNPTEANAWMRTHVRVGVYQREPVAVELL